MTEHPILQRVQSAKGMVGRISRKSLKNKGYSIHSIVFFAIQQKPYRYKYLLDLPGQEQVESVFNHVCEVFGISREDLAGKNRERRFVIPRHIFCYVSYHLSSCSLSQIASLVGMRDHSSIIHGRDTAATMIATQNLQFISFWNKWLTKAPEYLIP